jgi:Xaa-Pro aminopeptidase
VDGAATAEVVATDALTPGAASLLGGAFPAAELIDGEQLLDRVRSTKVPAEVEAIRAAVGVAEHALGAAEAALAPGVTERHLTGVFMEAMAASGVTTPSGQDVAWRTSRERRWHRRGRDVPVEPGDLVAFEAGVVREGYVGEVGRTRVVGGDAAESGPLFARWTELRDRLLAACRTGAPASDLLEAYEATGNPPPPVPVARGLGLGFDLPLVTHALRRTAAAQRLAEGMVFTLTAHVWQEGVGSVVSHDPILLTAAGPELISSNQGA